MWNVWAVAQRKHPRCAWCTSKGWAKQASGSKGHLPIWYCTKRLCVWSLFVKASGGWHLYHLRLEWALIPHPQLTICVFPIYRSDRLITRGVLNWAMHVEETLAGAADINNINTLMGAACGHCPMGLSTPLINTDCGHISMLNSTMLNTCFCVKHLVSRSISCFYQRSA